MAATSAVVTGSQAMQQTLLSCQSLCTMSLGQIVDEDKIDPFPLKTTAELNELINAVRLTKEVLSRETLIYSRTADFSMYADQELAAMTAFVRETGRMLSVVLAGGREHFFNGQGMSMVVEMQKMEIFVDAKVKEYLMMDKLIETLEIKHRYAGKKSPTSKEKTSPIANHPDVSMFASIDAAKGASSTESLQKLADICEKFAGQCREVSRIRYEKCKDRSNKHEAREALVVQVEELMPMLRQHVLRIGLSKSTSNGRHENLGTVVDHSRLLTSLFTHQAVSEAHRAVEDCRERLLQEALFRRQKAEKRMERELAREEALAAAREREAQSPGRSPSQAGYLARKTIVEGSGDTTVRKSLSKNLSMAKRPSQSPARALWSSQRSESEHSHSHSPEKEKKEKKEKKSKRREDDSPDSVRGSKKREGKEKKDKGKSSSRSQSPKSDSMHRKK